MKKMGMILGLFLIADSRGTAVEVPIPSQAIIEVKGIVCSFCAYGARKNLSKVDFLDKSQFQEGLLIETEKGSITMAIQKGKKINFEKVYKEIQKGGYEISAIHLNLIGVPEKKNESVVLTHKYNGQQFVLLNDKGQVWDPKDHLGKEVSIQGVLLEAILSKTDSTKDKHAHVQIKSVNPVER